MGDFEMNGGLRREDDGSYTVLCTFTKIGTEVEAKLMSGWLRALVSDALDQMEEQTPGKPADDARNHAADVHASGCPHRSLFCSCGRERETMQLLRDSAARIEVASEFLGQEPPDVFAAKYALTTEKRP